MSSRSETQAAGAGAAFGMILASGVAILVAASLMVLERQTATHFLLLASVGASVHWAFGIVRLATVLAVCLLALGMIVVLARNTHDRKFPTLLLFGAILLTILAVQVSPAQFGYSAIPLLDFPARFGVAGLIDLAASVLALAAALLYRLRRRRSASSD